MRKLRVFTWHIHGSYLYYLAQVPHDFYVPVLPGRPDRYFGRTPSYPWPQNLHEVPAEEVRNQEFDCVIYQHSKNYSEDRFRVLSDRQMKLPAIYIEHDPPRQSPTDTQHIAADSDLLLVQVTHFNALMWNAGSTRVRVIEHGIKYPDAVADGGHKEKGIVVINNIKTRGRRLGWDIYQQVRREIPLDLVGMQWSEVPGGIAEVPHAGLFDFMAAYRFFFNPIRYTSLGLAVLEAMSAGVPVVGLATTEMVSVIRNEVNGFVSTSPEEVVGFMRHLLRDRSEARRMGREARRTVEERFSISRFARDWSSCLEEVCGGLRQ